MFSRFYENGMESKLSCIEHVFSSCESCLLEFGKGLPCMNIKPRITWT
jgi:hypothetical protein